MQSVIDHITNTEFQKYFTVSVTAALDTYKQKMYYYGDDKPVKMTAADPYSDENLAPPKENLRKP